MANSLLHARRASPGPATPSSPRFPVSTAQLSSMSRVPRGNTAWLGVFVVVALLLVTPLVLWAPASPLLSLALLVTVAGAALLAAVVGAVRNAWRGRRSRR